jgi:hypothetical protein
MQSPAVNDPVQSATAAGREKKQNTPGHAWRIIVTLHLLCSQWTDCADKKLKILQNVSQQSFQESGRSPVLKWLDE